METFTQLTRLDLRNNHYSGLSVTARNIAAFAQGEARCFSAAISFQARCLRSATRRWRPKESGSCDIRGNDWNCPLLLAPPSAVRRVTTVQTSALHAGDPSGRCTTRQMCSSTCNGSSRLRSGSSSNLGLPQSCNATTHAMSLDWSGGGVQALVRAANAAIQAVDPSGSVCFLNSVKTAPCNGWNGRHYGECRYTNSAGQPSLFGGSCTAQDRRAWAQWSARPSQCVQRNAQNCFFWPNDQFCG